MAAQGERRVAVLSDAAAYVGPDLARVLADRGHDLVVGDPAEGLVADLEARGATVATVEGVRDLAKADAAERLLAAALERFGRCDAAAAFTGRIVIGRFLRSSVEDLHQVLTGCVEAPYRFLRAFAPAMVGAGGGQLLLFTSAAGARPTPGAPLYSSARAGANMLVRNVAQEVAGTGVQVNAIGTNFMDFPEFLAANRAEDPEGRARVEAQVPMGRLGGLDELASLAAAFLDGTSRFATGQFLAFDGGWT
jgi:3-oxoacyl-[acyl-carrier protein] reductase